MNYDGPQVHFQVQPSYRVQLDQKLPGLGWKKVAAISGKVDVPGLIRLRLHNPGAALPEVRIACDIVPGEPNILNIPDWAETTFRPDGQNLRDKIREILARQELVEPFIHFAGDSVLQQVRIQELSMSSDETSVRLDFAVLGVSPPNRAAGFLTALAPFREPDLTRLPTNPCLIWLVSHQGN